MTPQQIKIVRENVERIAPVADKATTTFCDRLFALDSSLRLMFDENSAERKQELLMMLKFAVETLDRIDVFMPSLEALGRKHVGYGVRDEHYDAIGASLILTLRQMFGKEFTLETEKAWLETYTLVAGTMRRAAKQTRAKSAAAAH
jgi:hemoglobin-like flavoprotein